MELVQSLYALDSSTTIDLCLSPFPWATFRTTKAAIKLHTLLDLRGSIPTFISLTPRQCPRCYHTGHSAYKTKINHHNGSRVYRHRASICDSSTSRLFRHSCKEQSEVSPSDFTKGGQSLRSSGRSNNLILKVTKSKEAYPEALRRVSYVDPGTNKRFVFLTNIFTIPAETVAEIYKQRWQIELFFKWIKQHLRIKSFFGTSFNAVKTQIWVAISIYLPVAIMKKRLNLPGSLHTIL